MIFRDLAVFLKSEIASERVFESGHSIGERVSSILEANGQGPGDFELAQVLVDDDGMVAGINLWSSDLIVICRGFPGSINRWDFASVWRNPQSRIRPK